jgi:hypothetical protein
VKQKSTAKGEGGKTITVRKRNEPPFKVAAGMGFIVASCLNEYWMRQIIGALRYRSVPLTIFKHLISVASGFPAAEYVAFVAVYGTGNPPSIIEGDHWY